MIQSSTPARRTVPGSRRRPGDGTADREAISREGRDRLSDWLREKSGSVEALAADLQQHLSRTGYPGSPASNETIRKWRIGERAAIDRENLKQLAIWRGERVEKTHLWLAGYRTEVVGEICQELPPESSAALLEAVGREQNSDILEDVIYTAITRIRSLRDGDEAEGLVDELREEEPPATITLVPTPEWVALAGRLPSAVWADMRFDEEGFRARHLIGKSAIQAFVRAMAFEVSQPEFLVLAELLNLDDLESDRLLAGG